MSEAQAYRFRDHVALYAPGTVYLTAKDARRLAKALTAAARSVEREKFTDSNVPTVSVPAIRNAFDLPTLRNR